MLLHQVNLIVVQTFGQSAFLLLLALLEREMNRFFKNMQVSTAKYYPISDHKITDITAVAEKVVLFFGEQKMPGSSAQVMRSTTCRSLLVIISLLGMMTPSSGFISSIRNTPLKGQMINPLTRPSPMMFTASPKLFNHQQIRLHSTVDQTIHEQQHFSKSIEHDEKHNNKKDAVGIPVNIQAQSNQATVSSMVKVIMLSTLVLQNAGTSLLSVHVRKQTQYDGAAVSLIQEVGKVSTLFQLLFLGVIYYV
jgi:hypothetical protein